MMTKSQELKQSGADSLPAVGYNNTPATPLDSDQNQAARNAVKRIFDSLVLDYGDRFTRNLRDADISADKWKWRMYKRTYGASASAILDGYEIVVEQLHGQRMPTMDEIVHSIRATHRGSLEPQSRSSDQPALEFSGGIPGYVDALDRANIGNTIAQESIGIMRRQLADRRSANREERKETLAKRIREHDKLLSEATRSGRIRQSILVQDPRCGYSGCPKPGTRRASTNGSSAWYCGKHVAT